MKKSKKRVVFALLLLVAAAASALIGVAIFRRGSEMLRVSSDDLPLGLGRDVMRISLDKFAGQSVTGLQTIRTVNPAGEDLEEIVLRVFGQVQVTKVSVNDSQAVFSADEDDETVLRIAYPWKAGEEIELTWFVSAPLTGNLTLLTLPVLGVYENGAWRTDAWDALVQGSYAQAFDWDLKMEYNPDVDVHVGGAVLEYGDDPSGRILQARMLGARDVTLIVTQGKAQRYRDIAGVKVAAVADDMMSANRLLDQCEAALSSLASAGFVYPFPALTVVQTDFGFIDGYAASCLVAVPQEKSSEEQLRCLTRLIARQTFGVLAGNDPWQEPWLRQSLSSAAEMLAFRARKGQNAFETRFFEEIEPSTRLTRPYGVTVGAGVMRFGGDAEMTQVLRDQGAAMLLGIGEAIGYDALAQAMNDYAAENAGKIAGRQALEAALERASQSSWSGYLEDELSF